MGGHRVFWEGSGDDHGNTGVVGELRSAVCDSVLCPDEQQHGD